jgi:hypothetical protein
MSSEEKRGPGRPKGARNKSKLIKAQLAFDDAAELAAETLVSIMKNDTEALNLNKSEDVPMTIRLQACKLIIDKAIANEKDKVGEGKGSPVQEEESVAPPKVRPKLASA